ncbi:unnamed protein product, partial [Parascedosporium putredinis]
FSFWRRHPANFFPNPRHTAEHHSGFRVSLITTFPNINATGPIDGAFTLLFLQTYDWVRCDTTSYSTNATRTILGRRRGSTCGSS